MENNFHLLVLQHWYIQSHSHDMQENIHCCHELFIPLFELNYGHKLGICSLILLGNIEVIVMFKSITNLFLSYFEYAHL